jgi:hypothetical protein
MTHAVEPEMKPEYLPPGHPLMLMLRAAVMDDGKGGPWLTLERSFERAPRRAYRHHITVVEPQPYSTHSLTLCSGVELLGRYMSYVGSRPNLANPEAAHLRALGEWAVQRVNAPLWDADAKLWLRQYMGPIARDNRADEHDECEARVRTLRWLMAEEWLR